MIATITHHISKGVRNNTDSSKKFTWFKTNFNMPVPNLLSPNTTWTRYNGPVVYLSEQTTYDLTGFIAGYEICNGAAVWDWENNSGSTYTVSSDLSVAWRDSSLNLLVGPYTNYYTITVAPFQWQSYWLGANIGVAHWEVSNAKGSTYYFRANSTGTPAVGTVSTTVTMNNIPSTSSNGTPGYIWVEGNNLCYVTGGDSAYPTDYRKQTMVGVQSGYTGATAGHLWIDTSTQKLNWIGSDGYKYVAKWCVKQFASLYQNGPTGATFAGTSKAGYIWADREFGQTHLAYIGSDGYKYLTGGGDDPYA